MTQKREVTKETVSAAQQRLYYASLKLRGIAYLLKNQTDNPCTPFDFDEIQEGIGLTVEDVAKTLYQIWRILDEWEVIASRKK